MTMTPTQEKNVNDAATAKRLRRREATQQEVAFLFDMLTEIHEEIRSSSIRESRNERTDRRLFRQWKRAVARQPRRKGTIALGRLVRFRAKVRYDHTDTIFRARPKLVHRYRQLEARRLKVAHARMNRRCA